MFSVVQNDGQRLVVVDFFCARHKSCIPRIYLIYFD